VRVAGRRAYERARDGEAFELPEREITVYAFEERWREGERAGYLVECSAGTYVRSLVAELGDAYCLELRRTRVGPFRVEDADPSRVVPLAQALSFLPAVALAGDAARRAGHGAAVVPDDAPAPDARAVLLVDGAGPIAIAEPREDGLLKPVVGFRG
jgi:tRNA pseudouridine55 synthase